MELKMQINTTTCRIHMVALSIFNQYLCKRSISFLRINISNEEWECVGSWRNRRLSYTCWISVLRHWHNIQCSRSCPSPPPPPHPTPLPTPSTSPPPHLPSTPHALSKHRFLSDKLDNKANETLFWIYIPVLINCTPFLPIFSSRTGPV